MAIIKKSDVEGLIRDRELSNSIVNGILTNPSLMNALTREIATLLSTQIRDNVEFRKRMLIEAIEYSESVKDNAKGMDDLVIKSNNGKVREALDKAEEKIEKTLNPDDDIEHVELDDLDDVDLATIKKLEEKGVRVIYPNLKYRKPKYHNIGDVLKYVESENGSGEGVKLVIMNFND